MSSTDKKKKAMGADSADSNSVSSKTGDEKQPHMKGSSDTSNETNDPSSTSVTATVSSSRQQTSQAASRQYSEQPATLTLLPSLPEAAAAAAPAIKRSEKKPRRAGFMEQFLTKLRVMLDRESEIDGTIVRWSTDGDSFIIIDHNQFEDHTIPTYFGSSIVFTSFVRKLYRYGFSRIPSRGTGRYEFCSPTFRRLGPRGAASPAAAAAANTAGHNAGGNAGGGTSINNPANTQALLLQALAQTNQQLAPNLLPRQTDALAALLPLFQRINQQTPFPSQQSINVNNIVQGNVDGLQSLWPWQYQVPTIPQLNTALNNLAGGQWSSAQLMGNSQQSTMSNAIIIIHALMSLSGIFPAQPTFPNTNIINMPQSNVSFQSLLMMLQRLGDEERQRRTQANSTLNAIVVILDRILGQGESMIEEERRRRVISALGQILGSPGRSNNTSTRQNQPGIPPSAGNLNLQADATTDILQNARRDEAVHNQEFVRMKNNSQDDSDDEGDDQQDVGSLSSKKSPDDDKDDKHDDAADNRSLKDRLRTRKK